jgi:hypothetical protein
MALLSTVPASETLTAKTIVIRAINGIMYTVPTGKTFKGYFTASIGLGCQILINGVTLTIFGPTTPYYLEAFPLTLLAGDTVASGSSYLDWAIIGTEQ